MQKETTEETKKLDTLAKLVSEVGGIQYEMNFIKSRVDEAIYELEIMRKDLEKFVKKISKENKNGNRN